MTAGGRRAGDSGKKSGSDLGAGLRFFTNACDSSRPKAIHSPARPFVGYA